MMWSGRTAIIHMGGLAFKIELAARSNRKTAFILMQLAEKSLSRSRKQCLKGKLDNAAL